MGLIKSISRTALIPSVVIGNAITGVLQKATDKYAAKIGKESITLGRTTTKEASETTFGKVLGTSIAATGAALVVASGAASKLLASPKNKAIGLLTAGAASVSPTITNAVIQAPAALVDAGIKIGETVETLPTSETENKGAGGLLIAGATGLITGLLTPTIADIVKPNNETLILPNNMLGSSDVMKGADVITPQTQTLGKTSSSKRKKTRSKAQQQNISQRVSISINNQNKRYLNILRH